MIIGHVGAKAAKKGFALGSVIDDVEEDEVGSCKKELANFPFCSTWLFEQFKNNNIAPNITEVVAAIAASREAVRLEITEAMVDFSEIVESMHAVKDIEVYELPQEFVKAHQDLTKSVREMRRRQKLKLFCALDSEELVDSLLDPFSAILEKMSIKP